MMTIIFIILALVALIAGFLLGNNRPQAKMEFIIEVKEKGENYDIKPNKSPKVQPYFSS